jgi:hypothetical protein
MRKANVIGMLVLATCFCSGWLFNNALMLNTERLIVQVDKYGKTTSKDCGPCFGKMRWQKSLLIKNVRLTLTMHRDFTSNPWGFSPSDDVYDTLEIVAEKRSFKIKLSGGFEDQELDYNCVKKRKRMTLNKEGDEKLVQLAITTGSQPNPDKKSSE